VAIDTQMRDAWLRSMRRALDACGVQGGLRGFLDQRFAEVADFLRNRPDAVSP
jgi:hemoglobin